MGTFPYPPSPEHVSPTVMKPGPRYRKEVIRVAFSILLFVVVYLMLFAAAIVLTVLCCRLGIAIISASPGVYTLLFGIGCIILALMVIYFLVKFLFSYKKSDTSGFIELREEDEPELFAFIRQITIETKTQFPKKIFLSPEVNASVFYNSGFWSMFLPVRKNLNIGLGLMNSTNLSEFKAVLAHEFGHFSQYSMKLGSYVYNVNRIIYNMLFNNDDYSKTLSGFARVHSIFALFTGLVVWIVRGIQWIQRQVYRLINKNFMSLSREMEFHADSVSAAVSGGNQLVHALKGIEVAQVCYDNLFAYYNEIYKSNIKPENIYPQHTAAMQSFCSFKGIAWKNFQPDAGDQSLQGVNFSRITIKDQWASHPSLKDRETHLNAIQLNTSTLQEPSWNLFRNAAGWQKEMTEKLYQNVQFKESPAILTADAFAIKYKEQLAGNTYNILFKGFYDNRMIELFDLQEKEMTELSNGINSMAGLYDQDLTTLPVRINAAKSDLEVLKLIADKRIPVRTFDFDGNKCKIKQLPGISAQIATDLKLLESQLLTADKTVYAFFKKIADKKELSAELDSKYRQLFELNAEHNNDLKLHDLAYKSLEWIYTQTLNGNQANAAITTIKSHEVLVKNRMKEMLEQDGYKLILTPEMKITADQLLTDGRIYLQAGGYDNKALSELAAGLKVFYFLINKRMFNQKSGLVNWQLSLVN